MTVFFVDDEVSILQSFRRLLRLYRKEYDFSFFSDPQEVLQSDLVPDVLITDAAMPGIDGRELIARTKERYPDVKTVLISGRVHQCSENETCANYYISKPCDVEDLLRILEEVDTAG